MKTNNTEYNISYAKEIKELLSSKMASETEKYSSQLIISLQNKIQNYLSALNNWNILVSNTINSPYIQDIDVKPELRRYIAAKEAIRLNPQIEQLLKDGYLIIDLIREFFTGQHISYQIGVEYYGKLYEGYVSMEQIMSMAQVQPDWKGNINSMVKLRLSKYPKGRLVDMLDEVEDFKKGTHSTLYSSIRAYASSNKKYNKGNLYEVYRVLKGRYNSNEIPPAIWNTEEFEEVYLSVVRNTASFVKGGDILTEQVKFFGTSVPSLATLRTIRDALRTFLGITQIFSGQKLQQGLKYFFLKKEDIEEASLNIDNFVEEKINELIKDIRLSNKNLTK